MFKKEYGFSPDRFDAAIHTFFKEEPTMPVVMTKAELERKENEEFLKKVKMGQPKDSSYSTME